MVALFLRKRSLLGRYLVVPFLVAAVALIGPAAVAQTLCPPDCDMHKPAPALPSCCENPVLEREPLEAAGHGTHSTPLPQPCCDGKLCLDSSASAPELTIALNLVECDIGAPARLSERAQSIRTASPIKRSFEPDIKGPPIPVFIRTCVFLI